ncbi:MAG: T9SS type A sorting domain-containing protein [Bacteroidota bacterium]|nr:T9SS type A sorting domain-containing protein [Bacteroidota bacterium]
MKNYILKSPVLVLLIILVSAISIKSQTIQWTNTYGSTAQDGGESMVLTNDGGIAIAGFKSANNTKDVLLMKTDSLGNETWSRTYNHGINDWGRSLQKTNDGGFIIAGMTEVNSQTHDPFLIKTDSEGNLQWQQQYDYGFGEDDRAHAVWQTSDGGYILVGQTWLIHGSFGNYDMYMVKTDMNGNVQWKKVFFRENDGGDVALGVQQLDDGGYIIGGFTQSSSWASYIVRTDSLGNTIWSNIYEGVWQSECYDIQATPDGGFILTGTESSFDTDTDLLMIKLNSNGNLLWKKIYGTKDAEQGEFIQQLQDGGYIIAGMSSHGAGSYDMYVVRTNSAGDSLWSRTIGGVSDDRAFSVASPQLGTYFVTGWAWSYGMGQGDVYLVKLSETSSGITENNSIPGSIELKQNYPNPFNPSTGIQFGLPVKSIVSVIVSDAVGRTVEELINSTLGPGNYEVKFDGSNHSSGIYFYTLRIGAYVETKKMILLK